MGKGTDKLYITHSEWASEDAFSASRGSGASSKAAAIASGATFKRLPYNFCAVSLQPFTHPVCASDGTIFDLSHILPWLKKHGTNPVTGAPLKSSDLIKLTLAKNEEGEYVDPVTYKVFTDNTHIVALKTTGNVFAYDTVERLNIKGKMWRDLVSDEEFTRADIITLQDPQNVASRDLSRFKYLQDGVSTSTPEHEGERAGASVNLKAMGSSAKVLKAREAVEKSRRERQDPNRNPALHPKTTAVTPSSIARIPQKPTTARSDHALPHNAAQHTTGKAAASFTSTGLTPHTSGERATLTEEEYLLKPRRVKNKGYARISTNVGDLNVELQTEYAPRAVWNFVKLAQKGYYDGVDFHRNIRNFMIQGGDPTGTGKGGESIWGKPFGDELDGPLTHDARGVISMANKGKNTNTSQFFITYRPTPHLNHKHTIFGHVVGGLPTLSLLENSPVSSSSSAENRPSPPLTITSITIFVDPFADFLAREGQMAAEDRRKKDADEGVGKGEEQIVTWTGRRVRRGTVSEGRGRDGDGEIDREGGEGGERGGVGKYLRQAAVAGDAATSTAAVSAEDQSFLREEGDGMGEPPRKKAKAAAGGGGGGGFGNFDNW
ncbi:MAG: Peptidyl-prolyl cis-trans isomerase cyp8 [Caeruleum heppii]|nr:MAG: Peptidyl-prolyl cis-trans isomerase cyp8 [Caeruleum heppii]